MEKEEEGVIASLAQNKRTSSNFSFFSHIDLQGNRRTFSLLAKKQTLSEKRKYEKRQNIKDKTLK